MTDPRVSFAPGVDASAALAQALEFLRRDGVVVLDDLVDPALLARCRDEFALSHPDMGAADRARCYGPYEGRHATALTVERGLANRDILLPKPVSHLAKALLSGEYKVDSLGLLVSTPGAPDQVPHHDASLYPDTELDRLLPPFALAFSLPLITMDTTSGTTAFWRGSHLAGPPPAGRPHDFQPVVQPGSALLWDVRIHHAGGANRGTAPRPIIYSILSREWWVEVQPPELTGFEKLQVARDVHAAFRPRWKSRFSRAKLVDPAPAATRMETEHA